MGERTKRIWLAGVVVRWEARLRRYIGRFVPWEVADEIAQEGFARLWNHTDAAGHEREWLFCICRNLAIDHLRREKRVRLLEEDGVAVPDTGPGAAELLEEREAMTRIQSLVEALPPAQREVIRLKFQEGMNYRQISEVTGFSVSYVGVLVHEGMKRIRRGMKDW